jgi:tetratricopeptide (TPR) repeat protein
METVDRQKAHFPGTGSHGELLLILAAVLVVIVIYAGTLAGPFIFDDRPHIRENPHIRLTHLGFHEVKDVVLNARSSNRPVANITFALNYYLHRYNPVGYHLVNILIHIACGLLLYRLVKTTLRTPQLRGSFKHDGWIPFFTVLLWLVHPLQTQSVSYIVQRMTSLTAMFFILSLLLFAEYRMATTPKKKLALFAGFICAGLLALGTKETGATLPFFVVLYDVLFFQPTIFAWLKRRAPVLITILILFALIAWMYLGADPLEKIRQGYRLRDFTMGQRLLTELRVVIFYLSLMAWPHPSRLNLEHDFSLSHSLLHPPATALSLAILLVFISAAIYFVKRERLLSFCIFWFFGNLAIESSIIGLELVFEHRTYLPSMGALLAVVVLIRRLIRPQWVSIGLLFAAATIMAVWTHQRNQVWSDDVILWQDCVKKSPGKARPYNNLASVQARMGNFEDALINYQTAIALKPDYAEAHYSIGVILAKQGKLSQGITHFHTALQIDPNNHEAHNNLGVALLARGNPDKAIDHLEKALQLYPDYPEAHNNLGSVLYNRGNIPEAIAHYKAALDLNPGYAKAHNNLGLALIRMERFEEARHHFEEALRLYPGYEDARRNLEAMMATKGQPAGD